MIPKKEHIAIIEKFFNKMEELSDKIESFKESEDEEEIKLRVELCIRYFNMTDIWMMIDDYMFEIDSQIDIALEENPFLFERHRK